ncbi:hypothetical protein V5O48_003160 [Marasmius crinis-equi]|uniref:Uncharacterized protein n=1 Tax=Marasmius crinis-equi TaxID=585013 RepID=A0ABR3FTN1_9AGAR
MIDLVKVFVIIGIIAGSCFFVFMTINLIFFLRSRSNDRRVEANADAEKAEGVVAEKDSPGKDDSSFNPSLMMKTRNVGAGSLTEQSVLQAPPPTYHHPPTYQCPPSWVPHVNHNYNGPAVSQQEPVYYHQR